MLSCSEDPVRILEGENLYPWCIVAFDSLERSPQQRIDMLKAFGFTRYAYDVDKTFLDDMALEFQLAEEQEMEIFAVWFWLNAKRDSLHQLSSINEKVLEVIAGSGMQPTLWVSFSDNFFKGQNHEESLAEASDMITMIHGKATELGCDVALYNHGGWFGEPDHLIELMETLDLEGLSLVYNFHHAHQDLEHYEEILPKLTPYLSSVNINGMREGGPKILTLGEGDHEGAMIRLLRTSGYHGPLGLLGHLKEKDAQQVLQENLIGFRTLTEDL